VATRSLNRARTTTAVRKRGDLPDRRGTHAGVYAVAFTGVTPGIRLVRPASRSPQSQHPRDRGTSCGGTVRISDLPSSGSFRVLIQQPLPVLRGSFLAAGFIVGALVRG